MRQFDKVDCKYGAPMGRPEFMTGFDKPARCFRVRMIDGDYDDGSAYWGGGVPLFCAKNDAGLQIFSRSPDRKAAKAAFASRAQAEGHTIRWVN